MEDIYVRLAGHLEGLVMGYPLSEALIVLLKEMFTPKEAQVALAIPNDLPPLDTVDGRTIAGRTGLPLAEVLETLESLAGRNLLYSRETPSGTREYALLQVGYGMPQSFFWGGKNDETARKMARLVVGYFNVPTTRKVYGGVPTKAFKYSPAGLAVEVPMQGVLPHERIRPIVESAQKIALAHCPCRMSARILGRTDCTHSMEVCFKYDDLAEFAISRGIARTVSKDEALSVMESCEKEGLVHMVDNVRGEIKHTCNCCGHYCWNVGIIRRRKIPRDVLMAVYFIRQTVEDECIGCGACADICPVDAVQMEGDRARVDPDWCIGCGVCAVSCPTQAISIRRRADDHPPQDFHELHRRIRWERDGTGERKTEIRGQRLKTRIVNRKL
jgi:ferredoxin